MPAGRNLSTVGDKEYDSGAAPHSTIDVVTGTSLRTKILSTRAILRDICCTAWSILALAVALPPEMQANAACSVQEGQLASQTIKLNSLPGVDAGTRCNPSSGAAENHPSETPGQLIVIGFMGGRIRANDFVHREAVMAKELQQRYPHAVHAAVFANHDGEAALKTILHLLDENRDGHVGAKEKSIARIVIFGHSWGASETITLARRLNELSIPVLLTIQVDSVQKSNQNDGHVPPNVREAINFYQSEGLLHGRRVIEAMDPKKTTILGNYESTYRENPVSCAGYPWYARAFMKSHIEIENDPSVWSKIEALIQTKVVEDAPPQGKQAELTPAAL
jgi:hypothetical protein